MPAALADKLQNDEFPEGERDQFRRRLEWSDVVKTALLELSHNLLIETDVVLVAKQAVTTAAVALDVEFAALMRPDVKERLTAQATYGWPHQIARQFDPKYDNSSQAGYTISQRQPVAVFDYSTSDIAFTVPEIIHKMGIVSGLSVPMLSADRVVGVMIIHSRQQRRFGEDAIYVLTLIANLTAVALERIRLYSETHQRANDLARLYDAAQDFAATLEPQVVLKQLARHLVEALAATKATLLVLDWPAKKIKVMAEHGTAPSDLDRLFPLTEYTTLAEVVSQGEARTCQVKKPAIAQARREGWPDNDLQTVLLLPIMTRGQVLAVAEVYMSGQEREFTSVEIRLAQALGQHAASVLENARLFQAEQEARDMASALLEIARFASSTLEQGEVLRYIARRTAVACQAHRCTIWLLTEDGDGLQPVMSQFADGHKDHNLWQSFKTNRIHYLSRIPVIGQALESRRPVVIDVMAEPDRIPSDWTEPFGVRELLLVPLVGPEQSIGLMALDQVETNCDFTPEQVGLALVISGQVTTAIVNARRYSEAEQRAAELAALVRAGEALNQAEDADDMLHLTLVEALKLMNCEQGSVILVNEANETLSIVAQVGLSAQEVQHFNEQLVRNNEGTFADSIGRGQMVEVVDTASDPRIDLNVGGLTQQLTNVPLKTRGRVIGVLALNGLPHDDRVRRLLQALADLAATAIEKAWLFHEVKQLASTDDLTGLHNRRYFFELASHELTRARRYKRPLAALLIDIDLFKRINDSYGHSVGDEVLRAVAARCRQNLRTSDLLGRYGGEELVVLLPENDLQKALEAAERLRQQIGDSAVHTRHGPLSVTISIGVATLTDDCPDVATLLDWADTAMYAAKSAGRNRVEAALPPGVS